MDYKKKVQINFFNLTSIVKQWMQIIAVKTIPKGEKRRPAILKSYGIVSNPASIDDLITFMNASTSLI